MNLRQTAAIVAATLLAVGCAAPLSTPIPPVRIDLPFDENAARAMLRDGVNQVRGSAFLRQQGGGVVTCAGARVFLVPATGYARQRIAVLYGNDQGPSVSYRTAPTFTPDPPEYRQLVRETQCDAQGNFVFDRVADGTFFVQTTVAWVVAGRPQGGPVMRQIRLEGGQIVNVVVAPQ